MRRKLERRIGDSRKKPPEPDSVDKEILLRDIRQLRALFEKDSLRARYLTYCEMLLEGKLGDRQLAKLCAYLHALKKSHIEHANMLARMSDHSRLFALSPENKMLRFVQTTLHHMTSKSVPQLEITDLARAPSR
ncbi:MAG TPA: hypothetical protein VJL60_05710 [Gammaproteobacteria bacterium]|nr:hypothetical protein [Gammaproteobacteria bacterium]